MTELNRKVEAILVRCKKMAQAERIVFNRYLV